MSRRPPCVADDAERPWRAELRASMIQSSPRLAGRSLSGDRPHRQFPPVEIDRHLDSRRSGVFAAGSPPNSRGTASRVGLGARRTPIASYRREHGRGDRRRAPERHAASKRDDRRVRLRRRRPGRRGRGRQCAPRSRRRRSRGGSIAGAASASGASRASQSRIAWSSSGSRTRRAASVARALGSSVPSAYSAAAKASSGARVMTRDNPSIARGCDAAKS